MVNLEEIKQYIKKQIESIMNEKGIAKDQLALEAGISTTTVSDILLCKYDISVNTLYAICQALGVYYGEIIPVLSCLDEQNIRLRKTKQEYMSVMSNSRECALNIILAGLDVCVNTYLSGGCADSNSEEKEEDQKNVPVSNEQHIARQIERIQKNKGFKQWELAGVARISSNTLSRIVNGKVNMKVSTLLCICEALEVFPEELLPQPTWANKREYGFASIRHKLVSLPSDFREMEINVVEAILAVWDKSR